MSRLINNENLQHYTNKMCNADNRKVGSKSLPTALNDIDSLIDEMKTNFDAEYGTPLCMKLENIENVFSVGTGTNIDKRSEVENSFTDVELSGNSLVNLWVKRNGSANLNDVVNNTNNEYAGVIKAGSDCGFTSHISNIKSDTYTVIFDLKTDSTLAKPKIMFFDYGGLANPQNTTLSTAIPNTGWNTYMLTKNVTKTNGATLLVGVNCPSSEIGLQLLVRNIIVLEGDWTNKPIPQYFEGMKSVGQDDVNGHKIEILSQTLNLVDDFSKYVKGSNQTTFTKINNHSFSVEGNGSQLWQQVNFNIPFIQNAKAGDTFTLFAEEITLLNQDISGDIGIQMRNSTLNMSISNSWQFNANKPIRNGLIKFTIPNDYNGTDILDLRVHINHSVALANKVTIKNLMIAKGHVDISSFKPYELNKKEILLNEPLRGLPNGVKDTIEKVNGEWKIVRKVGSIILNGSEPWKEQVDGSTEEFLDIRCGYPTLLNRNRQNGLCDKFNYITKGSPIGEQEGIQLYTHATQSQFIASMSKSRFSTVDSFKEYLAQNHTTVLYELVTPIIEDISPITLQCWKNGTISIDEVLPVESTHTVALNKPAQIKRNIEELTELRNRVKKLEETLDCMSLDQALQFQLLNHSINLDK